jgi:hypothetical protein
VIAIIFFLSVDSGSTLGRYIQQNFSFKLLVGVGFELLENELKSPNLSNGFVLEDSMRTLECAYRVRLFFHSFPN